MKAWFDLFHEPAVQVLAWVVIAVLAVAALPPRYHLLAVSAAGAIFLTATKAIDAVLQQTGFVDFAALVELVLVFVGLIIFLGPIAIAADRTVRGPWRALSARGARFWGYALAAATGLAATAASLAGLWWVNEVHVGLQGSFDLAFYGGVFASCWALMRFDRLLDGSLAGSSRDQVTGETGHAGHDHG